MWMQMQFIPGYNINVAVEARYTKQNTSTLPFKFRISSRKKSSNIGNIFLPPNSQKTARPISQALAPQWCWSATVCINVRERGTTIEIAPKFRRPLPVPLPSICHQLLLHTFNAIFIKSFRIFLFLFSSSFYLSFFCEFFEVVVGGFRWLQMVLGGFRWFQVVPCFSNYV